MTSSLGSFFAQLARLLPPMLAEDEVVKDVSRSTLAASFQGSEVAAVATALAVVERLFCAMALLHPDRVAQGHWRFNSYSAWLVARSLLETLASDHHTIVDSGYWSPQPSEADVDEQRTVLKRLENARLDYHPAGSAQPIRFVYVAWAVIRLGEEFLLYAREDRVRADARGDFVLPGGRFKLSDAPMAERSPQAERDFAYGISHWPLAYLQRSLYRELQEELDLSERDHYTLGEALDVAPYCRIEGVKNHHAYTEYHIRLFPLQLNIHGALRLFERLQRCPELFARFTADELGAEYNARGQRAFVTALVAHFGPKMKALAALPPAIRETYLLSTPHIGVDIPLAPELAVTSGRSGKPPKQHAARLTETEHRWLWALAWHAKSLPFAEGQEHSHGLLPLGWVRVDDISAVVNLRDKLDASGLPLVEIQDGRFARLSINPRYLYFDPGFFRYCLHGNALKGRLELFSSALDSPLGALQHKPVSIELNATLAAELRHLDGVEPIAKTAPDVHNLPRMLDEVLGTVTKDIGIRQLIAGLANGRHHGKLLIAKGLS